MLGSSRIYPAKHRAPTASRKPSALPPKTAEVCGVPLSPEMLLFLAVCQLSVGGLPKVSGAKVLSGGHLLCVSSHPLQLLVHPTLCCPPRSVPVAIDTETIHLRNPGQLVQAQYPSLVPMHATPRHLYIGGDRANRTIHLANASAAGLDPLQDDAKVTDSGMTSNSTAPLDWHDPRSVELRHDASYQQSRCAVSSVHPRIGGGSVVEMMQPCWRLGLALGSVKFPSEVINIGGSSAADLAAGEWYWNNTVFLYSPRSDVERTALLSGDLTATVPVAEQLLEVRFHVH